MPFAWDAGLIAGLRALNQILTAGIAITAFSLFLYSLSFNLRNRVAQAFLAILVAVAVIFTAEALLSPEVGQEGTSALLRMQWLGLVFLPSTYLHLSDALLATAGRPSRGRRRWAVRFGYLLSVLALVGLLTGYLVGPLATSSEPARHLSSTPLTAVFAVLYIAGMVVAIINFIRAYRRVLTLAGRRRLLYLIAGASAPALGSFPYLVFTAGFAAPHPIVFWLMASVSNATVGALLVVMAYSVAFFGVSWPDRVIRSRLLKWLLRGPLTASLALGLMTIIRRGGALFGIEYTLLVPLAVVATVLLTEHAITIFSPVWERYLFFSGGGEQLRVLRSFEDRLVTAGDLNQFLDAILAAARDQVSSRCAFVAALDDAKATLVLTAGDDSEIEEQSLGVVLQKAHGGGSDARQEFVWGNFLVFPLHSLLSTTSEGPATSRLLGVLGISLPNPRVELDTEQLTILWALADRAVTALDDRRLQSRLLEAIQEMQPQADMIQKLRAASRYTSRGSVPGADLPPESDMANWVKEALTHYWGGPGLTRSPLMALRVTRALSAGSSGNAANGLRALLRKAVDTVKPVGERRFTNEWLLYNILEMKFMEGRKVREIAGRLAMSEADLYRKQRVAVEAVAVAILRMEKELP